MCQAGGAANLLPIEMRIFDSEGAKDNPTDRPVHKITCKSDMAAAKFSLAYEKLSKTTHKIPITSREATALGKAYGNGKLIALGNALRS